MRALSMTLPADRRLLRKDGLHRCFALQASREGELVVKQLLPSYFASEPTLTKWFDLVERNARLGLAGCTQIDDWGVEDDAAFFISHAATGVSLTTLLDRIRACEPQQRAALVAYVGIAVLEVLEQAQRADPELFHLDLDPDNITVRPDGSLVLSELGLWTVLAPAEIARGRFDSGRVHYCSPELVQSRVADTRSDIFSIGVVLYRVLSGELPFTGATQLLIAMAIAEGQRVVLSQLAPDTAGGLCDVIEVMLATSPDERFQAPAAAKSALMSTLRTEPGQLAAALARLVELPPATAMGRTVELGTQPSRAATYHAGEPSRAEATRLSIAIRPALEKAAVRSAPRDAHHHTPPPPMVQLPPGAPPQAGLAATRPPDRGVSGEPQPPPMYVVEAPAQHSHRPSDAAPRVEETPRPAAVVLPEHPSAGPLRANDGRTSHLKVPPSGLSRPLVELTPAPPGPPMVLSSGQAYQPPSLALPALSTPMAMLPPSEPRRSLPSAPAQLDAGWVAPKSSGRWRDPSDTVFQMKSRPAGAPKKQGKSSLLGVLLLSTFLGFIAVVGLYLVYRLL